MKINTQITEILNQRMDRKNFLKYSGGALLAILGFSSILNVLLQPTLKEQSNKASNRYGNNPYGR